MTDDDALFRGMIAAPDDATPRLVYADWLDERGDSRAAFLREEWDVPRLSFADWVVLDGNPDYFFGLFPDLRDEAGRAVGNARWRELLAAEIARGRGDWAAVADTLGRPFRPFFFWNNTGPRSFAAGDLPFREALGTRGPLVTFASAFRGPAAWQPGLAEDLGFLSRLRLTDCEYGSTRCPVYPFACELDGDEGPLTGAAVLRALRAADFRTAHTPTLDAAAIPYPGYHPGTRNDEAHTDPAHQVLFPRPVDLPDDDDGDDPHGLVARNAVHEQLRGAVAGGVLWYVLLHSRIDPPPADGRNRRPWVVVFAVGRSARGGRLIGVVSHQMCHNLCD